MLILMLEEMLQNQRSLCEDKMIIFHIIKGCSGGTIDMSILFYQTALFGQSAVDFAAEG